MNRVEWNPAQAPGCVESVVASCLVAKSRRDLRQRSRSFGQYRDDASFLLDLCLDMLVSALPCLRYGASEGWFRVRQWPRLGRLTLKRIARAVARRESQGSSEFVSRQASSTWARGFLCRCNSALAISFLNRTLAPWQRRSQRAEESCVFV